MSWSVELKDTLMRVSNLATMTRYDAEITNGNEKIIIREYTQEGRSRALDETVKKIAEREGKRVVE